MAHVAGSLTALDWSSPAQAVAFVVVQQGLFGLYLGCRSRPTTGMHPDRGRSAGLRAPPGADSRMWPGRLVDFVLGGSTTRSSTTCSTTPRPNLRSAQPLIRAFYQEHGLAYTEASLLRLLHAAIRHLHNRHTTTTRGGSRWSRAPGSLRLGVSWLRWHSACRRMEAAATWTRAVVAHCALGFPGGLR